MGTLNIGIDVHKKMCTACLRNEEGQIITEVEFENKKNGFQKLLELLEGKEAKAAMESTANLWIRLYTELEAAGVGVVLSNPSRNRVIAESVMVNDKFSARTLAELLRTGFIARCHVPPPEVRAVRGLIRYRVKLVQDLTRVKSIEKCMSLVENEPEFLQFVGSKGTKEVNSRNPYFLVRLGSNKNRFIIMK